MNNYGPKLDGLDLNVINKFNSDFSQTQQQIKKKQLQQQQMLKQQQILKQQQLQKQQNLKQQVIEISGQNGH